MCLVKYSQKFHEDVIYFAVVFSRVIRLNLNYYSSVPLQEYDVQYISLCMYIYLSIYIKCGLGMSSLVLSKRRAVCEGFATIAALV